MYVRVHNQHKNNRPIEDNSMSSRRVHGALGGGASTSESDNTSSSDESGSLLEAVCQSTQGEDKKSGKESPVSSNEPSPGRSLTTTSGSGSYQELGARPKVVERGRKSYRGRSNVWHNPNRRSAKNLKGYGQKIAATAEGNTGSTTSSTSEDRFVIVGRTQGIGPRRRRGPGSDCSCSTKGTRHSSTDLSLKDSVVLALLTMPVILVLLYDSSTTETGSTSPEVTRAVRSHKQSVGRSLAASIPLCAMIIIKLLIFMFSRYGKPRKQ